MMNGKRRPVSGRELEDSESERFVIESKERQDGVPGWIEEAVGQAVRASKEKNKLPLVMIHKKGDRYINDLCVMRFQDFERVIDDSYLDITDSFHLDSFIPEADYDYGPLEGEDDASLPLELLQSRLLQALEVCAVWRLWQGEGEFRLPDVPASLIVKGRRQSKKHMLVSYIMQLSVSDIFEREDENTQLQFAAHVAMQARLSCTDMTEYITLLEVIRHTIAPAAWERLEKSGMLFYETLDSNDASLVDYVLAVVTKES